MFRVLAPLLLLLGSARAEAAVSSLRLWTHGDEVEGAPPRGTIVLLVPPELDQELEALAAECGYQTRAATEDDLRQSYPVLSAREVALRDGRQVVHWDLRYSRHAALVRLWDELRALEVRGDELGPAARAYLASAR